MSVIDHCGELAELHHLVKYQRVSKADLTKELYISIKCRNKMGDVYSEVGDSNIDSLLLRCLPFCESYSRCNRAFISHLIPGNGLPESFEEPRHLH